MKTLMIAVQVAAVLAAFPVWADCPDLSGHFKKIAASGTTEHVFTFDGCEVIHGHSKFTSSTTGAVSEETYSANIDGIFRFFEHDHPPGVRMAEYAMFEWSGDKLRLVNLDINLDNGEATTIDQFISLDADRNMRVEYWKRDSNGDLLRSGTSLYLRQ